mmetsp:Transcript_35504/g.78763  ORF Transcript_35504/g.78763 Transcript_35504/m.78763 type:complete len:641 (+) Transcript_35504:292-2214(+)|eukprot:CAMPEP_0202920302 /NCGR_PEP_ID=MMETSP1392-20130828/76783_1 /ASSEMBLY_ACC=CAM_ASM_000868 /TAXON_ID=225041 /ORGANISM="Chlamydomonas chlamydogama, Strain SAG 11-48b" /LENGTH=640 /DNA_ID=CAMNT_0049613791 /DNA_START=275 /DNA_END=2197 /DNA_ORIENTATION=+
MVGRYLAGIGVLLSSAAGGSYFLSQAQQLTVWAQHATGNSDQPTLSEHIPTRAQQLSKLRESTPDKPFDLLIIGGGATGTGCAVDAATRGLRTVLVEREDFGSGTSSKSTKLVHGGVRYLEKAVFQLDIDQLKLVFEALKERRAFLANAAHLAHPLPIVTPCYSWFEVPYYWAGLKAYDLVAGTRNLIWSRFVGAAESVNFLPTLAQERKDGRTLKGTILYYDGQFNDARMNVTLACTAAAAGAVVANYVNCTQLIKNQDGKVVGAKCKDAISGREVDVYAKVVVNATGVYVDKVRRSSNPDANTSVTASTGAHVTLPEFYGSGSMGMIIPRTKDGRVVFMLPWQGKIIAGTTDEKCEVLQRPRATEEEVTFILDALSDYLNIKVRRADVLSTWSGIRPLPYNPKAGSTQNIVRDHLIYTDDDGLITVTGGKWTTYRRMAEEVVDTAVATGRLPLNSGPCITEHLRLVGAQRYTPALHAELAQLAGSSSSSGTASASASGSSVPALSRPAAPAAAPPSDPAVALHLARSYGDRAPAVLQLANDRGLGRRLVPGHDILEAEVVYCVQNEYCESVEDFLCRRTRLAFLDAPAALSATPRVAELMAEALSWSSERRNRELAAARRTLSSCFVSGPTPDGGAAA